MQGMGGGVVKAALARTIRTFGVVQRNMDWISQVPDRRHISMERHTTVRTVCNNSNFRLLAISALRITQLFCEALMSIVGISNRDETIQQCFQILHKDFVVKM